jgi:hypothetical protein
MTSERGLGVFKAFNLTVCVIAGGLVAGTVQAAEIFRDDFDGEALDEHWDLINPDPENYIVENGFLLTLYAQESSIENDHLTNLVRLRFEQPEGDWQATIRLLPEFQTMREVIYFGMFQDKANYLMSALFVSSWCCYARNLTFTATKSTNGRKAQFSDTLSPTFNHGEGAFKSYRESFRKLGAGLLLRLSKIGREYVFSGRIEGVDEYGDPHPWISLSKLVLLRPKGRLVFGFTQSRGGGRHQGSGGESIVNVDWVKIETVE